MIRGILRVMLVTIIAMFLMGSAFIGGFAVSRQLFPPAPLPDGGAPAEWKSTMPVFWEAWNYVHQDYYKPTIEDSALVNGAVSGMVEALGDPHTAFVDARRAAISSTTLSGSFEGIGATVEMREGRLTVVAPIKDSPADKAGIRSEDIILEVNNTIIQNMDVTEAVSLIRGPKGTTVTLKVQRARLAPFEVSIVRDTIKTSFVESRMIEGTKIAYVRLNDFGATAPDDLHRALQTLLAQNPTGLVFDLRQDPGGYLNAAVDVTSEFLPPGQMVLIEREKDGTRHDFKAKPGGIATKIPMVLLVDKGSASASEIVAAAIKDYKRATIVGTTTFGKGSVQNVHALSDQSELRVTIAHFFSPLDHEINDVGVAPDVHVEVTEDDLANKRDPQLDKAVEILQSGKTSNNDSREFEITILDA